MCAHIMYTRTIVLNFYCELDCLVLDEGVLERYRTPTYVGTRYRVYQYILEHYQHQLRRTYMCKIHACLAGTHVLHMYGNFSLKLPPTKPITFYVDKVTLIKLLRTFLAD